MENTRTDNLDADDAAVANAWVSNLVADSDAYTRPVFGTQDSIIEDDHVQTSEADDEGGGSKVEFDDDGAETDKTDAKTVDVRGIKF